MIKIIIFSKRGKINNAEIISIAFAVCIVSDFAPIQRVLNGSIIAFQIIRWKMS